MKITGTKRVYDGYYKIDLIETPKINWEVIRAKPAVALFLYNKTNNCALFVRQCRASMISTKNPSGVLIETVAGRCDKEGLEVEQIASSEAYEEAGVMVSPKRIKLLNNGKPFASSAGMTDEFVYLAYAEITNEDIDNDKTNFGAAGEGEEISGRQYIPVSQLENHEWDNMHTAVLVGFFLRMKKNK